VPEKTNHKISVVSTVLIKRKKQTWNLPVNLAKLSRLFFLAESGTPLAGEILRVGGGLYPLGRNRADRTPAKEKNDFTGTGNSYQAYTQT
jgi:hypothetical protein